MLLNTKTRDQFIYILKLITYFDTFDLDKKYEQRGGADKALASVATNGGLDQSAITDAAGAAAAGGDVDAGAIADAGGAAAAGGDVDAGAIADAAGAVAAGGVDPSDIAGAAGGINTGTGGEEAPDVEKDQGGTVNGVNVQSDNNFLAFIIRSMLKSVKRISVYISNMFGKYAMLFIFAATFPALPFFACMGFMYATVKYAMFKFREL